MTKFQKLMYVTLVIGGLTAAGLLGYSAERAYHFLMDGTWTLGLVGLFVFSYIITSTVQRR